MITSDETLNQCSAFSIIEDCYWFLLFEGILFSGINQIIFGLGFICDRLPNNVKTKCTAQWTRYAGTFFSALGLKWNVSLRWLQRGTVMSLCIPLCLATDQLDFAIAAHTPPSPVALTNLGLTWPSSSTSFHTRWLRIFIIFKMVHFKF